MADKDTLFTNTVDSLMKGMNGMLSTKTVVGEAIHIGDTIILPLVDVSFGVGAGAFQKENSSNGGGGLGGKMSPSAVLVIQNGSTRLINVKEQDGITKLLDMVPDFVNRFTGGKNKKSYPEEAMEYAKEEMEDMLDDSVN
ncbi:MAG: GerW family sporulation protein [Eubacterium sp.]|nr:GerW family sporulation protein [Eubacterium sp.]